MLVVCEFLLSRERVRVRVAVPRPLRRSRDAIRLGISREPRDECQRRVAAGSDSGRREEELPGLVLVEDPAGPRLPKNSRARGLRVALGHGALFAAEPYEEGSPKKKQRVA